ncbi:AraC family transcriptional regulator [Akkermansiaceae bacterium]|nr:AraC family transcriptional regulator [Akkermansiaceae bacterium]MDA7888418.1 AraC family transcriptional regulator [Akkermansiaceae bacterium]MDB4544646.1 AraC family transcriptional regulator [Akkermansiaceae bacterium]
MIVFWEKDREGRFLGCNSGFEELHGMCEADVVGKTDFDFHAPEIASGYRAEDELVMRRGEVLANQLWMVPDRLGVLHWWVSTKTPVRLPRGEITGVAGAMYEINDAAGVMSPYRRIEAALQMMHESFRESLRAEELAGVCHLSVSQFNRVFRGSLKQSPKAYLNRLRINASKKLLIESEMPLSEIAVEVGFYDGSEFGKRFREQEGMTPRSYRVRLRQMIETGGR